MGKQGSKRTSPDDGDFQYSQIKFNGLVKWLTLTIFAIISCYYIITANQPVIAIVTVAIIWYLTIYFVKRSRYKAFHNSREEDDDEVPYYLLTEDDDLVVNPRNRRHHIQEESVELDENETLRWQQLVDEMSNYSEDKKPSRWSRKDKKRKRK